MIRITGIRMVASPGLSTQVDVDIVVYEGPQPVSKTTISVSAPSGSSLFDAARMLQHNCARRLVQLFDGVVVDSGE